MIVSFTVPGRIRGKGRPRFSTRGGQIRTFTDAKTRATEATMRDFAFDAMRRHGDASPMQGPLKFEMTMYVGYPKSWSAKRKAQTTFVTGRPDADNYCKAALDSMNGIVYRDDAQVADLRFLRLYTIGTERVEFKIQELASADCIAAPVTGIVAA